MEVIHKDPLLILEQYGLKKTNVRKLVLEVFLSVNHALSQPTVEETLGFVEIVMISTCTLLVPIVIKFIA